MGFYFALTVLLIMYCGLVIASLKVPPPKTMTPLDIGARISILFICLLNFLSQSYLFFFTDSNEIFGINWWHVNLGIMALHSVLMGYVLYRSEQPQ